MDRLPTVKISDCDFASVRGALLQLNASVYEALPWREYTAGCLEDPITMEIERI
jgi:hypothetical protein